MSVGAVRYSGGLVASPRTASPPYTDHSPLSACPILWAVHRPEPRAQSHPWLNGCLDANAWCAPASRRSASQDRHPCYSEELQAGASFAATPCSPHRPRRRRRQGASSCCNVAVRMPIARNIAVSSMLDPTYLCAVEAYSMTRMKQGGLGAQGGSTVFLVSLLVLGPSSRSR